MHERAGKEHLNIQRARIKEIKNKTEILWTQVHFNHGTRSCKSVAGELANEPHVYLLFTFEALLNLYLVLSRVLEESILAYLSWETIATT